MLNKIKQEFPERNFGLYRDDGLAAHRRIPGPRMYRIRKDIHELFGKHGLKITVETNQTVVNFLDVTWKMRALHHIECQTTRLSMYKSYNRPHNVRVDTEVNRQETE